VRKVSDSLLQHPDRWWIAGPGNDDVAPEFIIQSCNGVGEHFDAFVRTQRPEEQEAWTRSLRLAIWWCDVCVDNVRNDVHALWIYTEIRDHLVTQHLMENDEMSGVRIHLL
jgi:hypothetical protein